MKCDFKSTVIKKKKNCSHVCKIEEHLKMPEPDIDNNTLKVRNLRRFNVAGQILRMERNSIDQKLCK